MNKTKAIVITLATALVVFAAFAGWRIYDDLRMEQETAGDEGLDDEYYGSEEPPLNDGLYYLGGDKSSAYWFEVKDKCFTFCGDVDKAIGELEVIYFDEIAAAGSESKGGVPIRDEAAPAEEEQNHPTYKELIDLTSGGKLKFCVDEWSEYDDEPVKYWLHIFADSTKTDIETTYSYIYVFDYISQNEFSRNGKTFKPAE